MASSSNERNLKNLVINKVDSQATFDQMKKSGLINADELYLIKEGTKDRVLDVIVNGGSTVVDGISNFNVPTVVSELENDSGYITTAEETDPVFSVSAAAGITSNDIQNWNNKTSNIGTITGVSVNGTSIATSGVANITSVPASILTGTIPNGVTATTQTQSDNSTKIATTAYVDTAIGNLPEPMVFKGSLGTGGTITALPTAAASNEGHTYKVIKDGTYAGQAAKVGDTFISTGSRWELIPSGDEPSGTVTSVTLNATSPIAIDNSAAITTSGTRTISHATSGVSAGTYKSVTVNSTGHVTGGTNPTTLSGYGITDAKIANGVITLGNNTITPLTEHQDITGKQDKITASNKLSYDLISGTPTIPTITDTYSATSSNGMSGKAVASAISGKQDTLTTQTAYSAKGSATKVPQITTNTLGQVTGITEVTITDNDTKNTAGSTDTSSKIFLVGATSQAANPQTYSHDTAYVGTDGCLYSGGTKVLTAHQDISGKQDKLTTQTAYSAKGSATKVPQITTNTLGQVTGITEVTIAQPTVNNATLTIQKNGTNVATFGANASSNVTANITVPTVTDTYSASSSDAMSGKAVASALSSFSGGPKNIKDGDGVGSVYTSRASKPTANYAFAEGYGTQALEMYSHAEGYQTISNGAASHAEGYGSFLTALDTTVHTIYDSTEKAIIIKGIVKSPYSGNIISDYIIAGQAYLSTNGSAQQANKIKRIDEVYENDVTVIYFEGTPSSSITSLDANAPVSLILLGSLASGQGAHAEGTSTIASKLSAHAEGDSTVASNRWAHAEGYSTLASAQSAHAEGKLTVASGENSHAEGLSTTASEARSHAEGNGTTASGEDSHAEGLKTISLGYYSHAEGNGTIASGTGSHAEGYVAKASGSYSHAEGFLTEASGSYQHVQGQYNIKDTSNKYAHIVGNGADNNNRANAHTLDWDGNAWFAGDIKIGGTGYDDSNAKQINVIKNLEDGAGRYGSLKQARANSCSGNDTTALGINTIGEGDWSFVSGYGSVVKGQKSTAMGNYSCALYTNSVAIGDKVTSQTSNGIAIGNAKSLESTKDELYIECPISNIERQNGYTMVTLSSSESLSSAQIVRCIAYIYTSSTTSAISETLPVISYDTTTKTLTLPFTSLNLTDLTYIRLYKNATVADSNNSIAIGTNVQTESNNSVAIGTGLISNSQYQLVQGSYNNTAGSSNLLYVLGNGTNNSNRSNAMTVDKNGNAWIKGDIKIGGSSYSDTNATVLTSENFHQYVDAYVQEILNRRY